jgi:hypothetical protein
MVFRLPVSFPAKRLAAGGAGVLLPKTRSVRLPVVPAFLAGNPAGALPVLPEQAPACA